MSKFTTKIKGTTFYDIDFESINKGDKLILKREPENPYDKNAIKILHDSTTLGHVDKELASVLSKAIDNGEIVKAVIDRITGGPPLKYGILVNISIHKNNIGNKDFSHLGNADTSEASFIHTYRPNLKTRFILDNHKFTKEIYFYFRYGLGEKLPHLKEPTDKDIINKYKIFSIPFIRKNMVARKMSYEKDMWLKRYQFISYYNYLIENKKERYDLLFSEDEFNIYKVIYFINIFLKTHNISLADESIFNDLHNENFITDYELLFYEKIKHKYIVLRQCTIDGYSTDFLLFNTYSNHVYAIQVDGGIHRREKVRNIDMKSRNLLMDKGISLIRISNNILSRNIEKAISKLEEEIEKDAKSINNGYSNIYFLWQNKFILLHTPYPLLANSYLDDKFHFPPDFIVRLRKKFNKTKESLANLIGVSAYTYNCWETGNSIPNESSTEKIWKLAEFAEFRLNSTKKKILIVEHDRHMTDLAATILEKELPESDIFTSPNGLKALEVIRRIPINLVITELVMPGMDGIELMSIIQKEFPGPPIVVWTAMYYDTYVDNCLEMGAAFVESKPVNFKTFLKKIKLILFSVNDDEIK